VGRPRAGVNDTPRRTWALAAVWTGLEALLGEGGGAGLVGNRRCWAGCRT